MDNNKNRLNLEFVNWLRLYAMVSIVLCHLVQVTYSKISVLSQFFNIGVQIFFIISGFCFGLQGEVKNVAQWYIKRIKKIFIPYEFFLLILMLVYCRKPLYFSYINLLSVIKCIFGVQGAYVNVLGANHTWYITSILLFYLALPWFSKLWNEIQKKEKKYQYLFLLSVFVLYVLMCIIPNANVYAVISPVFMCFAAYIIGTQYDEIKSKKIRLYIPLFLFCVFIFLRYYISKIQLGNLESLFVGILCYGIAFSICLIFYCIFKNAKSSRIVNFFTEISFEIFLFHNMFIEGPIFLMYKTGNVILNIVITVSVIFAVSYLANRIVKYINIFFDRKLRKEMK